MKRFVACLLAICFAFTGVMMADNAKALKKAQEKQRKEKIKQFKKEKWTLFGTAKSLDVVMLEHYMKLEKLGDKGMEVTGLANNFKSKNLGKQMAINSAAVTYAQQCNSDLKGLMATDAHADGSNTEGEFDHFYAAFERSVQQEIRGELRESFTLIHDNGDGTYDMQTFFVVDESGAARARQRALEAALKDTELAQKQAEKISNFVNKK